MPRFEVLDGKEAGKVVDVTSDEACDVGTSRRAKLRIPDRGISYSHARIVYEGDAFVLRDLRSTEGTFVNGARVDEARLRSGDEITFGKTRVRFVDASQIEAPPAAPGTGRFEKPAPATGRFEKPAPGTGRFERPAPGTGRFEKPAPAAGRLEEPAPAAPAADQATGGAPDAAAIAARRRDAPAARRCAP
ncbi:MAG: FHA domain-containing protein [Planctomycetes bacterium]|nr:FHA domain-containing protein [Planctomycetota bacterium]